MMWRLQINVPQAASQHICDLHEDWDMRHMQNIHSNSLAKLLFLFGWYLTTQFYIWWERGRLWGEMCRGSEPSVRYLNIRFHSWDNWYLCEAWHKIAITLPDNHSISTLLTSIIDSGYHKLEEITNWGQKWQIFSKYPAEIKSVTAGPGWLGLVLPGGGVLERCCHHMWAGALPPRVNLKLVDI